MNLQLDMIGIITKNFDTMVKFYSNVLGYKIKMQMDNYAEFENDNIRFAISTAKVMKEATGHAGYDDDTKGHSLELAFLVPTSEDVDSTYTDIISKGAEAVKAPEDMPWGQRAAFFADPDGNVHEIFTNLKK